MCVKGEISRIRDKMTGVKKWWISHKGAVDLHPGVREHS